MLDILDELRQRALFGGMPLGNNSPTSPDMGVGSQDQTALQTPTGIGDATDSDQNIIQRIQNMFTPQMDAQNRLRDYMDQAPQRKDYPVSFLRKLAAGAVAGGDPKEATAWANKKFNQADSDWRGDLKPIEDLAVSERANNSNQRMLANQMINSELRQKDIDRKTEADKKTYEARIAGVQQRDRYLAFKKYQHDNPNHQYKVDKQGKVYSIDPQTDEVNYLTDDDGEFIDSNTLPDAEKLRLQNGYKLGQIAAQGSQTRQNIAATGGQTRQNIAARGDETRKTDAAKPASARSGGRTDLPSTSQFMRAREVYNSDPTLKPYIVLDHAKKTFEVNMPAKGGNAALYRKAVSSIYGTSAQNMKSGTTDTGAKIRVISPDGKPGSIPASQLDSAIKQGYKKVE